MAVDPRKKPTKLKSEPAAENHTSKVTDKHPAGIKGLCWGGFFLSPIWAIPNKTYIGLVSLVPLIGLPIPFILLFKGREWAWKNRHWTSVAHFQKVQRRWAISGLAFYILALSLLLNKELPSRFPELFPPSESDLTMEDSRPMGGNGSAPVIAEIPGLKTSQPKPIFGNDDSEKFVVVTSVGTIKVERNAEQERRITLNGQVLFDGLNAQWLTPVGFYRMSSSEVILVENTGGRGSSCETMLLFLVLEPDKPLRWTPEFGTCVRDGTIVQSPSLMELSIPKIGGHSTVTFDGTTLIEDGKPMGLRQGTENDPSN